MLRKIMLIVVLAFSWIMSSCSYGSITGERKCPDGIIDYVDAFKWNDIQYTRNIDSDISNVRQADQIGEIGYTLSGHACLDYQMKNGDATLMPTGTGIYQVTGYKPEFRLMAKGQLYEVSENSKAKTIGDIYDITGKVAKISFESTGDGSHISYFSPEATEQFVAEYSKLTYIGFAEMYKKASNLSGEKDFLRIQLKDGSSFRVSYWSQYNAISPGAFGTDELKRIIVGQRG